MNQRSLFTLALFVMITGTGLHAQAPPSLRIGFGLMGNVYRGDMTTDAGSVLRAEPGATLTVDVDKQRPLRLQFSAGFGGFTEQFDGPLPSTPEGVTLNPFVRTTFFHADVRLQYRFFRHSQIRPYLAAGLGMFSFQPRDAAGNFLGENIFSRLPEEEYLTLIGSMPLSGGLEWSLSPRLAMAVEYTYRMTGSDYLDNVGLLGHAAGNDQLHQLQYKVMFSLGQPSAAPAVPVTSPPTLLIESEPPVVKVAPEYEYWRSPTGLVYRRRIK